MQRHLLIMFVRVSVQKWPSYLTLQDPSQDMPMDKSLL